MRFIIRSVLLAAVVAATMVVPGSALAQKEAAELRQLISEVEYERPSLGTRSC